MALKTIFRDCFEFKKRDIVHPYKGFVINIKKQNLKSFFRLL